MSAAIRRVVMVTLALSILMVGGRAEAREGKQIQGKETTTARLVSITEDGGLIHLRLENGKTISVGKERLRIRDHVSRSEGKEQAKVRNSSATTEGDRRGSGRVRQMTENAGRPGAVRIVRNRDGEIKRVQVHFFRSEADVTVFLQAGGTPKHQ